MNILYFAYGSNMCTGRLTQRVPSAEPLFVAKLNQHRLTFHKRSNDGSGKGDAEFTGDDNDCVWGVVFEMPEAEKPKLDQAEGLGYGYREKTVSVVTAAGKTYTPIMYYADNKDVGLRPYSWYLRFVLDGAKQHGLSADYLSAIEATVTDEDPDRDRDRRERAVQC